jgi:phosphatidylinositol kinase/protein kinase (PI-3  family)
MIDTHSGETVHVDFGCLFDRGLILAVSAGKVGLRFVPGYYLSVGM